MRTMSSEKKIHFVASQVNGAREVMESLQKRYGQCELEQADVIVVGQDFVVAGVPVTATYKEASQ